ncbi:MAG TPA: hypothetical protein VFR67_18830 [Pilimelia sp.]|nr:hypothetical protein [Pilimelia sp.]
MAGYVNRGRKGWTELRVHGVSGTPPVSLLQHPQVVRVAGDMNAGFYRRRYDSEFVSIDSDTERGEAYFWGGLTAGAGRRALWLLLTPFMLVNVAFFALPAASGRNSATKSVLRVVAEAVLMLFALSMTVTLALVFVHVAMDLIGWQCVRPGRDCTAATSWLGFLTWPWLASPGRRLLVMSLVPLAVVGLLWWLGRSTWLRLEITEVPDADPEEDAEPERAAKRGEDAKQEDRKRPTPLEDRRMWNGREPVRRLREIHVSAAVAVVGVFLATPLTGPLPTVVLVVLLALLGLTALLVCWPATRRRPRPSECPSRRQVDGYTFLPFVAVAVVAAAGVLAAVAEDGEFRDEPALPRLTDVMQWLVQGQLALLLVMAGLLLALRRWAPQMPYIKPMPGRDGAAVVDQPAWRGLVAVAFMMLAFVLAGGFAAGLGIRVADLLGTPATQGDGAGAFVVPEGYFWAAALTVILAVVLLVFAAVGWWSLRKAAKGIAEDGVTTVYRRSVGEWNARRADEIAWIWARAGISQAGQRLVGWFLTIVAVSLAAGLVLYRIDQRWLQEHARWLVNVGTFLVGGFVLVLLYIGWQAYRSPAFRRTVGVLWDIGTFWPRATHPLAPPCYTERTVPDLITRIRYLGDEKDGGRVLLSCHSQGAMIGTAVVMQLTYDESAAVGLLTYGSPLRRLYTRFFPGYFSVTALNRAGSFMLGCDDDGDERALRPWRNLHRPSDPIGGPLFVTYPATALGPDAPPDEVGAGDNGDVDRQLVDPGFARADGDTCDPATCGHSDYYADPAFAVSVQIVKALRETHPGRRDPGRPQPAREARVLDGAE